MYCIKCGNKHSENDKFCGSCGHKVQAKEEQREVSEKVELEKEPVKEQTRQPQRTKPRQRYAGFWLRAGAMAIDFGIVFAFIFTVRFLFYPIQSVAYEPLLIDAFQNLFIIVAVFLYFALMESSKWQATVGKKAVGLKVTDLDGKRISFGKSAGRYFSKIVSGLAFYIGYIMASFTEKKQGLHDIMTGCLVLKEEKKEEYYKSNDFSS